MIISLAAAPVQAVSAAELGNVIATLNDWRAILVIAFAVIGVLIIFLGITISVIVKMATTRSANDQATLTALTDNTRAMGDLSASVRAVEVIAARRESERLV